MTGAAAFRHPYAAHLGFRGPGLPLFRNLAPSLDPVDQIDFAASVGLAGMQDPWHLARPEPERQRIAEALRARGLRAASIVCGSMADIRTPLWQPRDTAEKARLTQTLDATIAAATRLGAHHVAIVTGRHDELSTNAQEELFVTALQDAGQRAADAGLTLVLEAINPRAVPGLLMTRFDQAARLVREVGLPSVKLIYDTAHLQATDGDLLGNFERARDIIGLVQLANHPGRTELAVGEINMRTVMQTIFASGFDGLIELEHLWSSDSTECEQAGLDWLRATDADL